MPFFREINPAVGIRTGIWKITETAEELLMKITLSDSEKSLYKTFRHDLRKKQWLAYRCVLKQLLEPFSTSLSYNIHGKPLLDSGSHHISVSHAGDFAAAVCSEKSPVGVDIEKMKERVERVKERFLRQDEMACLSPSDHLEQLYVYWGGKEALFKLIGNPDLDFRNDIHILPFDYLCITKQRCSAAITYHNCQKDYTLYYQKIEDYMLVVAF